MMFPTVIKLNSNYVPTITEAAILRTRLAEPEQRLHHLNTTISELQQKLVQLTDEKKLRERQAQIFKSCNRTHSAAPPGNPPRDIHPLPSVNAQLGDEPQRGTTFVGSGLQSVEADCAQDPASLGVHPHRHKPNGRELSYQIALLCADIILALAFRRSSTIHLWTFLHPLHTVGDPYACQSQVFDWSGFLNQHRADDVPLLEDIHVEGVMFVMSASGGWCFGVLDDAKLARDNNLFQAPRLRSLSILYWAGIWRVPIRWGDLTGLCLSGILGYYWRWEIGDVMKTLALCPNLETCFISLVNSYVQAPSESDAQNPTMDVYLPKLRSLSIEDDYHLTFSSSDLLKRLHAPNLRQLGYGKRCPSSEQMWAPPICVLDALSAFLDRLIHPLEGLELILEPLSEALGIRVLEMLPGLKRLSLRTPSTGADLAYFHPSTFLGFPGDFLFRDRFLRKFTSGDDDDENNSGSDDLGSEARYLRWPPDPSPLPPPPPLSPLSPLPSRPIVGQACLCPKLEVFHCAGAKFSDSSILDFLRSRSATLRMVDITIFKQGRVSSYPLCKMRLPYSNCNRGIRHMMDYVS